MRPRDRRAHPARLTRLDMASVPLQVTAPTGVKASADDVDKLSDAQLEAVALPDAPVAPPPPLDSPPDGGWHAWSQVIVFWCLNFCTFGLITACALSSAVFWLSG